MSSRIETLAAALSATFGEKLAELAVAFGEVAVTVKPADVIAVALGLRDGDGLRFEQLIDLCGVDYNDYGGGARDKALEGSEGNSVMRDADARDAGATLPSTDPVTTTALASPQKAPMPPGRTRFAVVYHLLSVSLNHRLRLRVFAADDELPAVDSVVDIWPAANWYEREAFDLFGIVFPGHPDLRRILTDYGFIGNPFRKDFPLSGNVEMRYDPDQGRVIYQPVTIEPRMNVPRVVREEHYGDTDG